MKLTTGTLAVIAFVFLGTLAIFAALVVMGKDATQLVTWVSVTIIPTITTLLAYGKASKGADLAAQAVHNTNGNTSDLIAALIAHGVPIPPGYDDVKPTVPASLIPDEFKGDTPPGPVSHVA